MDAPERQPCPICGESTPTAGRLCSHCQANLLVDVQATAALRESRAAYEVAREIKAQWDDLPFVQLKRGLEGEDVAMVSGVTRAEGHEIAEALQDHGVTVALVSQAAEELKTSRTSPRTGAFPGPSFEPSSEPSAGFGGPRLAIAIAVVVAAALGGGAVLLLLGGDGGDVVEALRPALATDSAAPNESLHELTTREIADRALTSTVTLRCPDSEGAGFFVAPDLIVTNNHVLCGKGAGGIDVVLADGRIEHGQPMRRDEKLDVAVVRIGERLGTPIPLGDATTLRHGDKVVVIGNPHGLELSLTQGVVSHNARNVMGVSYIQVDANVNPGNSGGPLFDSYGRAVGVVSMMVGEASGLGLALPVNYLYEGARPFVESPESADSSAWERLLAKISSDDLQEAEEMAATFEKPGLLGAYLTPRGQVIAVVIWQAPQAPVRESYYFELHRNDQAFCAGADNVEGWREVSDSFLELMDEPTRLWLEEKGLLPSLYAGIGKLNLGDCPRGRRLLGAELVLDGADPRAERAIVEVAPPIFR